MKEVEIVNHYLSDRKGGTMLDVGAHWGGSSMPFLKGNWQIWAFEPDPSNRSHLDRVKSTYPRLHISPKAISNETGVNVPFFRSDVSTGISSLSPFHESHYEDGRVDVTTLSNFCEEHSIDRVDFLKIDAEGHDLFVLQGFPWEKLKPAVVMCEYEDFKTSQLGYSFNDLVHLLVRHGYEIVVSEWYPVERYGGNHKWKRFHGHPCVSHDPNGCGNILGFHNGVDWFTLINSFIGFSTNTRPKPRPRPQTETKIERPSHSDNIERFVKRHIHDQWRLLKDSYKIDSLSLFGAGKHTSWFVEVINDAYGPEIECIFDDDALPGQQIKNIPVLRPSQVRSVKSPIVLSTDVNQLIFDNRCRQAWGDKVRLINLYDGLPLGPYPKV